MVKIRGEEVLLLFWAVLIAAGVALFRYLNRTSGQSGPSVSRPTPEQLLAERFARGEIDEHEYHQRLDILRSAPTHEIPR